MNGLNLKQRILDQEIRVEKKITLFRIIIIMTILIIFSIVLSLNSKIPINTIIFTYILFTVPLIYSLIFYFLLKRKIFHPLLRYLNSFFDVGLVCFIMISIYLFNHFIPNLIILIGVPHLFFFLVIILSGLRLDWKITLFNGILAGITFLLFYLLLLPENINYLNDADLPLLQDALGYLILPKGAPFMRAVILIIAGIIATYASLVLKKIIFRLNRSAEERINHLEILLTGIAHNLNNPLNYLTGFNEHLKADIHKLKEALPNQNSILKIIDSINENQKYLSASVDKIVNTLKLIANFSPKKQKKSKHVNINTEVEKILKLLHVQIKQKAIEIQNKIKDDYYIDFPWLGDVLLNLILNAIEAVSQKGRIKVFIIKQKQSIKISVQDNGQGIEAEDQSKVFLPYYTTKGKTGNRGLGLSLCNNLVKNVNAQITFTSTKGNTTFFILIPKEYIKEIK